jgi:hypothetical protein
MRKQVLKAVSCGGKKGCYDILHLLKSCSTAYLQTSVVSVADKKMLLLAKAIQTVVIFCRAAMMNKRFEIYAGNSNDKI